MNANSMKNMQESDLLLEMYNSTGDIDYLIQAENLRVEGIFQSINDAAEVGREASSIYNGSSLAADALSIMGGIETGLEASSSQAEEQSSGSGGSNSDPYMKGQGGKICVASGAGMNRCSND